MPSIASSRRPTRTISFASTSFAIPAPHYLRHERKRRQLKNPIPWQAWGAPKSRFLGAFVQTRELRPQKSRFSRVVFLGEISPIFKGQKALKGSPKSYWVGESADTIGFRRAIHKPLFII